MLVDMNADSYLIGDDNNTASKNLHRRPDSEGVLPITDVKL